MPARESLCQTRTASRLSCGRPNGARWRIASVLFLTALIVGGCRGDRTDLVVYCALDRDFSEPILEDFTAATALHPLAKYDIESTKTVGLTQAIISEAGRPRCDVFWNNEILNTLRLEQRGLLEAYPSPAAKAFPAMYRSPQRIWCGFAARARVLLVNTQLVSEEERPRSIYDLADVQWKGQVGIAKPLFGTTATHAACLFSALGEEEARELWLDWKRNDIQILSGNKQVAQAVAAGQIAFGLTDTDDAMIEVKSAQPVAIIYPDQGDHKLGTLFIPNTVAILKNCRHPEAAKKLVDYLLSPPVEGALAKAPSAQIPLNPAVQAAPQVETPQTIKAMAVNFTDAAKLWDQVAEFLRRDFLAE